VLGSPGYADRERGDKVEFPVCLAHEETGRPGMSDDRRNASCDSAVPQWGHAHSHVLDHGLARRNETHRRQGPPRPSGARAAPRRAARGREPLTGRHAVRRSRDRGLRPSIEGSAASTNGRPTR
jgi:hypothetical protein